MSRMISKKKAEAQHELKDSVEKHSSPVYKAAIPPLTTRWCCRLLFILYLHLAGLKSLARTNF